MGLICYTHDFSPIHRKWNRQNVSTMRSFRVAIEIMHVQGTPVVTSRVGTAVLLSFHTETGGCHTWHGLKHRFLRLSRIVHQ